uniref:Ysc84 actin-binding domain-containing protein n=1 Tax=Xiphophorus couchianus TaxID=32473 RepID=A0A3B5MFK7_9TELE
MEVLCFRNLEADIALRSTAAVFTYCRSRGLFAGISLEGSYLMERKDTNRKFYCQDIRASCILNGDVEPPTEFFDLYHILDVYTEAYTTDWTNKNLRGTVLVLLVLPVRLSLLVPFGLNCCAFVSAFCILMFLDKILCHYISETEELFFGLVFST